MAACGRSDQDRMTKIKEKWACVVGLWSTYRARRGSIVAVESFFSTSDGPNIFAMKSSIN